MQDSNETNDVQKDIHALWNRINQLENLCAMLIGSAINVNKHGGAGPVNVYLEEENLNQWYADHVHDCCKKLIEETGGSRGFIDEFMKSKS